MSDQFQHVMVLTSIIIGLGITNALLGVSGAIERYTESDRPLQFSWASAFWLAQVFLWMILFWWWEFRLVDILKNWTLLSYFLIICYAVVLFLLVALLIPRDWDKIDDLNAYFLSKRRWFYSVYLLSVPIDLMDSYMKGGWTYIIGQGVLGWGYNVAAIPVAVIGFRSSRIRTHTIMAIVIFVWQVVAAFNLSPLLHRQT
jgi:hypothetical protein